MTEAAKGLPAVLREWAGNYEEGSFDTEAGLMTEAAEALEAQERLIETQTEALEAVGRFFRNSGPGWLVPHNLVVRIDAALSQAKRIEQP